MMADRYAHLPPQALADLDRRIAPGEGWSWQRFYADRARPCPFFVSVPDENLVEWFEQGRIEPGEALDVGCGNGRNALWLAQHGFRVRGIDLSPQAIAWALERSHEFGTEHADDAAMVPSFVCGSVFDHVPEAASLDLIYDGGCFHHMPPHRRHGYAQMVARALRPGGKFVLVCFTPEGGGGLSDDEVYERQSLGGGMGYSEGALHALWGAHLEVVELRRMREVPAGADSFGKGFLWVLLARAR